jgi:uncharacterized integral membrane protein
MKSLLNWILFLPLAVLIVVFAVINRQSVNVVLDPFGSDVPGLRFEAPLFAVMFLSLALGVLVGGVVTWIRQGRHRRALRDARTEIASLRAERIRLIGERQALPAPRDHAA